MSRSVLVSLSWAPAMLLLAGSAIAQASYVCPTGPGPGERQVGMVGGSHGVGPVAICAADGQGAGASPSTSQPADLLGNAASSLHRAFSLTYGEMEKMKSDPRHARYMKGEWSFYDNVYKGEKICAAQFSRQGKAVLFFGPGDPREAGFMAFIDYRDESTIPRPASEQKIRLTLAQNGDAQTVSAINHVGSSGEGVIRFAVPRMQAIVESVEEVMTFKVTSADKVMVENSWHSGHTAREVLRKCIGH